MNRTIDFKTYLEWQVRFVEARFQGGAHAASNVITDYAKERVDELLKLNKVTVQDGQEVKVMTEEELHSFIVSHVENGSGTSSWIDNEGVEVLRRRGLIV